MKTIPYSYGSRRAKLKSQACQSHTIFRCALVLENTGNTFVSYSSPILDDLNASLCIKVSKDYHCSQITATCKYSLEKDNFKTYITSIICLVVYKIDCIKIKKKI